ncbi:hypothetical protein [Rhizobium sp. LC145]|uniref:hypothetical protein n=1 Tax=Rhizobium sp. LC145 TaxID=1120688 RepID=UPI00062A2C66|nr:hypothetical protein [Rhizobium sp. LC145]KKX29233.1 hypothetical protein YH62_15655 [Rhizobium sp. LC145]TKT68832.1 hypothetical protein FDR95_00185 [Rhizobiaceae bacterium LC148]
MSTETKPFAWYWYDATGCLFITGDDRKPDVPAGAKPLYTSPPPEAHVSGDGSLKIALEMTGCQNEENLIDMANVGNSLMERIDSLVSMPGPYHRWSPADDPAEIVFDLVNDLDELREANAKMKAALEPFAKFRSPGQVGTYEDRIRQHFSPENFASARDALATTEGSAGAD